MILYPTSRNLNRNRDVKTIKFLVTVAVLLARKLTATEGSTVVLKDVLSSKKISQRLFDREWRKWMME